MRSTGCHIASDLRQVLEDHKAVKGKVIRDALEGFVSRYLAGEVPEVPLQGKGEMGPKEGRPTSVLIKEELWADIEDVLKREAQRGWPWLVPSFRSLVDVALRQYLARLP